MMTPTQFNAYWQTMRIMHLSLVAGAMIFAGITHFVLQPDENSLDQDLSRIFQLVIPALFVIIVLVSLFALNRSIARIRAMDDVDYQLAEYRRIFIIRWAMAEFVTLLSIVGYLLSGNLNLMILALLGIVYLFFQRPDRQRMVEELNLNQDEIRQLEVF